MCCNVWEIALKLTDEYGYKLWSEQLIKYLIFFAVTKVKQVLIEFRISRFNHLREEVLVIFYFGHSWSVNVSPLQLDVDMY